MITNLSNRSMTAQCLSSLGWESQRPWMASVMPSTARALQQQLAVPSTQVHWSPHEPKALYSLSTLLEVIRPASARLQNVEPRNHPHLHRLVERNVRDGAQLIPHAPSALQ